ncbi:protein of unknown function [Seinonella peptonophila]|uniref:DUF4352 domain-containing protein n=1 Tax=Seinonella peptonophila TaxID=112248 RepID=A0A1M5B1P1_9BACL|nr:DUF4352 domain-containing protein [Seinonella peptonophila]SHF36424.1 protein of unknown function [Seinonella peptonophila]
MNRFLKLGLFGCGGIIALIMLAFVAVFVFADSDQPVIKTGSTNNTTQSQDNPQAPKQIYKVGDIVKIGDTMLIIKSAKIQEAEQYVPAKKGNVLVLEVEGQNKGSQSWFLSDTDFNLYDTSGGKLEPYFSGQDISQFGGEVNQGKKVTGKLRFDVPNVKTFELIYKPNFLTSQEIKFDIQPK